MCIIEKDVFLHYWSQYRPRWFYIRKVSIELLPLFQFIIYLIFYTKFGMLILLKNIIIIIIYCDLV